VWVDSEDQQQRQTASMSDVSFRIECRGLPVDHTAALAKSLCEQQTWLSQLQGTGIHPIHVAGSQNGWQRPDGTDELLLLSKRTRLRIRIDSSQTDRLINSLEGTVHSINDHSLRILGGSVSALQPTATLFSRYTVYLQDHHTTDEQTLVQRVIDSCRQLGYNPNKILCGRSALISTADGPVTVRSVLLADVPAEFSLLLQEEGLGDLRIMGCGILIPHKDTGAVHQSVA